MDTPARINLAAEPPFRIGKLTVRPSLLEVEADEVCHPVPPRVMQVLVALADAGGRTVSRDELAERCWHGRIVGEDALNRIIAKLRAVALGPGEGTFTIETVKRIGYRLIGDDIVSQAQAGTAAKAGKLPARSLLAFGAAMLGLGAAVWFVSAPPRAIPPEREQPVAAASDLETRGLSAVFEGDPARTAEGIGYLRQATAMTPRQPAIWGSLAMAYVLSLPDTPAADRDAVVTRIREAAGRAQALDRREGRSIAALASLAPTFGHWREKDGILEDGLRRATPGTAPLIFQRVLFLSAVGRSAEALELADQLNKTSPLVPWIQAARINLLTATGRLDEAERVAGWAGGVWPTNRLIWFTRFDLAAYGGHPEQALALAAAGAPEQTEAAEIALAIATAQAIKTREPAAVDALLAKYRKAVPLGQGYCEQAVRVAAALGRPHEALVFADALFRPGVPSGPRALVFPPIGLKSPGERNTALLFVPPASALWSQAGFATLVSKVGLVDYWRRSSDPDLCRKHPAAFCRSTRPIIRPVAITSIARNPT